MTHGPGWLQLYILDFLDRQPDREGSVRDIVTEIAREAAGSEPLAAQCACSERAGLSQPVWLTSQSSADPECTR